MFPYDIGSFGNVLDGGFGIAFFAEQDQRRAEKAFTEFSAAADSPGSGGSITREAKGCAGWFHDYSSFMTIGHFGNIAKSLTVAVASLLYSLVTEPE